MANNISFPYSIEMENANNAPKAPPSQSSETPQTTDPHTEQKSAPHTHNTHPKTESSKSENRYRWYVSEDEHMS